MSGRMNYGKRFRSGAVSVGKTYDERMDRLNRVPDGIRNMTEIQKVFAISKLPSKRANPLVTKAPEKDSRMEAEERLVETIQRSITALVFGIQEMDELSNKSKKGLIVQNTLLQAIHFLCASVRPTIPFPTFYAERKPGKSVLRCHSCGAPSVCEIDGERWCDDCAADIRGA